MSQLSLSFDGTLAGVARTDGEWSFEGTAYDTPAADSDVIACANEALEAPDAKTIEAARKLVFAPGATYTAQALLAIEAAYVAEVGDDGAGTQEILAILRETARRIACIEALTI